MSFGDSLTTTVVVPGGVVTTIPNGTKDGQQIAWDVANNNWKLVKGSIAALTSGATDGETLRWNAAAQQWLPKDIGLTELADVTGVAQDQETLIWDATLGKFTYKAFHPMPSGINDGDVMEWDSANNKWISAVHLLGNEDNVNGPPKADAAIVYNDKTGDFDFRDASEFIAGKIGLADVKGLIPALATVPLPGNIVGQAMRWSGTAWTGAPIPFQAPPATSTSPGEQGQLSVDATHIYMCVAKNTWKRMLLDTSGGW